MTGTRWEDLTREEIGVVAPASVLVIPVGAIEQHGPHLTTAVDAVVVGEIARRGAERASAAVLLAPTVTYGSSHHHLPFGGTLSLSSRTLALVLGDLCASATAAGVGRTLLLNGHGGNSHVCAQVAQDAAGLVAAADYWRLIDAAPGMSTYPGHAGEFETSVMLELFPERVRIAAARPSPGAWPPSSDGLTIASQERWTVVDGFTDDPTLATRAKGEHYVAVVVDAVAAAIDAVAGHPTPP